VLQEKDYSSKKNNVSNIKGYIDSNWAGDQTDRRFISGYLHLWKVILSPGGARSRKVWQDQV
jgi:hypothetical protein